MRRIWVACVLMATCLCAVSACLAADQEPVPSITAVEAATTRVRELFKDDYARRAPADVKALADRLLKESNSTSNDAATRYALGMEAIDLLAKAGDSHAAIKAVDVLVARFDVDDDALRDQTLTTLSRNMRGEADRLAAYMDESLPVIQDYLNDGRFERAMPLIRVATQLIQSSSGQPAMRVASDRLVAMQRQQAEYLKIKPMLEKLEAEPQNAAANTAVGKYYCFVRNEWDRGLPLLAAGDDAVLRDAAAADIGPAAIEQPKDDAAKKAVGQRLQRIGDTWVQAATHQLLTVKPALAQRAIHWYGQADKHLAGLDRVENDRKIEEAQKLILGSGRPAFFAKLSREQQMQVRKFRNKYYLLVREQMNHLEAQAWARKSGGSLVAISDAAENEFVHSMFKETKHGTWIGFTDAEKEGTWMWLDGSRTTYTNWEKNEPNNHKGHQDHARMYFKNGKWDDVDGRADKCQFIVQWKAN